jgi:hypothetical protein
MFNPDGGDEDFLAAIRQFSYARPRGEPIATIKQSYVS